MQVLVALQLVEVPSQSWVHFSLQVMAEDLEGILCPGIEVSNSAACFIVGKIHLGVKEFLLRFMSAFLLLFL